MKPKWPRITWNSCNNAAGDAPRILGLNPWIHDFAAFNLWSRPAGLLAALDMFRACGARIALMDCLDQTWSDAPWPKAHASGKGHYPKTRVPKPAALHGVPRHFSRYGHDRELVRGALAALSPAPDLVLITTIMTYWYLGAAEAVTMVRELWPRARVVLGGIYATLCPEHASCMGADAVLPGPLEQGSGWDTIWRLLGQSAPAMPERGGFSLALDLYDDPGFSVILGSRGCPFRCTYCASRSLYPGFRQDDPCGVLTSVQRDYQRGVRHFAFYDDALLVNPEAWLWPLLDWLEGKGVQLHTPNAMHVRYLTPEVCGRLKRAGLSTVRLGLETTDFAHRFDSKLNEEEWQAGIAALRAAGFGEGEVGAYILFGLPDQDMDSVRATVRLALASGIRPELAHFTPIPSSPLFERACEVSPFPLRTEPLCQNNSIWPCVDGGFSWDAVREWRRLLDGHE